MLNKYFVNITKHYQTQHSYCDNSPHSAPPSYTPQILSSAIPTVTADRMIFIFKDIQLNKAIGLDHPSVKILRLAIPYILDPLIYILLDEVRVYVIEVEFF